MITQNLKKRLLTSLLLTLLVFLIFKFSEILVFVLLLFGVFSLLEFFQITKRIFISKVYYIFSNIIFTIYIFTFCVLFFLLSQFLFIKILLFYFLIVCISSDIGGYVFGNIFKGPKLIYISPNKTISGAIGSIIFSCLSITPLIYFYAQNNTIIIFFTAIVTSIACQFGDLFFSYLKRKAKLKDTGKLLPGHGGVLDRIDSVLIGLPFSLLTLTLFFQ